MGRDVELECKNSLLISFLVQLANTIALRDRLLALLTSALALLSSVFEVTPPPFIHSLASEHFQNHGIK